MFFKKKTIINEAQTLPEDKPIYILGNSAMALYFAAKLTSMGHNAWLLTPQATSKKDKEITFKEEYSLQKQNLLLKCTTRVANAPLLIIIASNQKDLRANLSLLPGQKYPDTPIMCFNQIENMELLHPLLGTNFCQAYFNGYIYLSGTTLSVCGSEPQITLSAKEKNDQLNPLKELIKNLGFECLCQENNTLNFWQNNISQIIGYLASKPKQHITDLLKTESTKENIMRAVKEISLLAKQDKVKISPENIIRRLLETPKNFYYKNTEAGKTEAAFVLDRLYNTLSKKSRFYKCKIPTINQLIKQNYDDLLKNK